MDASRRELLKVNIGGKEIHQGHTSRYAHGGHVHREDQESQVRSSGLHAVPGQYGGILRRDRTERFGSTRSRPGCLSATHRCSHYGCGHRLLQGGLCRADNGYIPILLWQSTNRNTAFVPTVEQNGKTQWTANIKGDSGGIEQSLRFPAGEYCFRLKSLAWLGTVYAISLD